MVSQETTLFDDTIKNNIAYANMDATEKDIKEAAKLSYCEEFINELPNKYETIIGENGIGKTTLLKIIGNLMSPNSGDIKWSEKAKIGYFAQDHTEEFEKDINVDEEIIKIKEDLEYQKGFLKSVNAKLENKRFTENAPEMVIQNEIKKKDDAMSKISVLTARLDKLEN